MSLMRGNNWRSLRSEMDRLFDDVFGGAAAAGPARSGGGGNVWAPAVDIAENQDSFIVRAELPGLKPEDIDIELENNVLSLKGERRFERSSEHENYHFVERSYGSFFRSFSLPRNVDSGGVQASFEGGVLTISIPKAEEARPRKVQVSVGGAESRTIEARPEPEERAMAAGAS